MSSSESITLLIALWGAVISTVLAIREAARDKRRLTILIEYVMFYHSIKMIIVNSGHRPLTIVDAEMRMLKDFNEKKDWFVYSNRRMFIEGEFDKNFPRTLNDGEHFSISLSSEVANNLRVAGSKMKISLMDAEGNVHTVYRIRHIDPRYGFLFKPDKPSVHYNLYDKIKSRVLVAKARLKNRNLN